MKPRPPLTKVRVIERSLRCFVLGLAGLVPVIGLPFSVMAIVEFGHVKQQPNSAWNPAARYLSAGLTLATLGLLATLILVLAIIAVILQGAFG
ncbi:MAG: hypothetical protein ACYDH9_20765 [Limisphaerales bacterium]